MDIKKGRSYVNLGGKHYHVFVHDDGRVSIGIQWESILPSDVYMVHPRMLSHSRSVSPYGRLGKRILKALPQPAA